MQIFERLMLNFTYNVKIRCIAINRYFYNLLLVLRVKFFRDIANEKKYINKLVISFGCISE